MPADIRHDELCEDEPLSVREAELVKSGWRRLKALSPHIRTIGRMMCTQQIVAVPRRTSPSSGCRCMMCQPKAYRRMHM